MMLLRTSACGCTRGRKLGSRALCTVCDHLDACLSADVLILSVHGSSLDLSRGDFFFLHFFVPLSSIYIFSRAEQSPIFQQKPAGVHAFVPLTTVNSVRPQGVSPQCVVRLQPDPIPQVFEEIHSMTLWKLVVIWDLKLLI